MSYIYEALKRAESENARAVGAPTAIRRPTLFAAKWRWWLWLLIGVLGANAALVITLVLFRGARSPGATRAPTGSTDRGAGEVTFRSGAESADVTPPAPRPLPPAARALARPVSPAPQPAGRAATAVRPSSKGVDPPAPASTPAAIIEARPASPPTAGAGAPGVPPASAAVPQNSPPTAVDEPKLKVQVVVYSDVPAQRMVFIDGRRYAEGDKVDAETVVERITPEGAVVTRRGQSFALTSGRP